MKRRRMPGFVFLLAIFLSGCGRSNNTTTEMLTTYEITTTGMPTTYEITTTGMLTTYEITTGKLPTHEISINGLEF